MQVREFREQMSRLTVRTDVYARSELKGTWFPGGHQCSGDDELSKTALRQQIDMLEQDNAALKRRISQLTMPTAIKPATGANDPLGFLDELPKQDQEFFSRKLGKRAKRG